MKTCPGEAMEEGGGFVCESVDSLNMRMEDLMESIHVKKRDIGVLEKNLIQPDLDETSKTALQSRIDLFREQLRELESQLARVKSALLEKADF